jgi:hypothetical protein
MSRYFKPDGRVTSPCALVAEVLALADAVFVLAVCAFELRIVLAALFAFAPEFELPRAPFWFADSPPQEVSEASAPSASIVMVKTMTVFANRFVLFFPRLSGNDPSSLMRLNLIAA